MLRLRVETRSVRGPAELYEDQEALRRKLRGDRSVEPDWVERSLSSSGRALPPAPVLEAADLPVGGGRSIRAVRIATFTWRPNSFAGSPEVDRQKIQEQLRWVDLVFCIDATGSMEHLWEGLQKYFLELIEDLRGQTDLDIRIGIVAYRDYERKGSWECITRHCPLTDDMAKVRQWIEECSANAGGDWEEAMLDALAEAIEKTAWRTGSFRAVLLAADNASHPPDSPQNPQQWTVDKVAEIAQKKNVHVFTLQLPSHPDFIGDGEALPKQLRELARRTDGEFFQVDPRLRTSPADLIAQMRKALEAQKEQAEQSQLVGKRAIRGKSPEEIQKELCLPSEVFERVRADLDRRFPNLALFRLPEGWLGFEAGWCVLDSTVWEECFLISEDGYRALVQVCDLLIRMGVEDPRNLRRLYVEGIRSLVGDPLCVSEPETVRVDWVLKLYGIPLRPNTLLQYDLIILETLAYEARRHLGEQIRQRRAKLAEAAESPQARVWAGFLVLPTDCLP